MFTQSLEKTLKQDLIIRTIVKQTIIGFKKDDLGKKIMVKFAALRSKTYRYLTNASNENKKAKTAKRCVTKEEPKFKDYQNYLEVNQFEDKINYLKNDRQYKKI